MMATISSSVNPNASLTKLAPSGLSPLGIECGVGLLMSGHWGRPITKSGIVMLHGEPLPQSVTLLLLASKIHC